VLHYNILLLHTCCNIPKKISILGKHPEGVSQKGFSYLSHVTQIHHKWVPYNIKGDTPHKFDLYASFPDINPGIGLQNNITWDNTN